MKSLVLDTSNRYLVVALYENGQLLAVKSEAGSKRQSENAIPYIETLLNELQWELFDLTEVIVTRGPGSYTGERVGLTIAKTLKTVHPATEVKMVSSLAAYAGVHGNKISVIDARSHKVFIGIYQDGKVILPEQMINVSEFKELLKNYPNFIVVGETDVVGMPETKVLLHQNMYDLAQNIAPVKSVHELIPHYIKDVEAKTLWHA